MKIQSHSVLTLPDGKPLAVVGRKKANDAIEKVTGTHFMQSIFMDSRFAGRKHYFYGTAEEDIEEMPEQYLSTVIDSTFSLFL